jgi:hypothetical protein
MAAKREPQVRRGTQPAESVADGGPVKAFMDRFAELLTEGNGRAIALLWQVPALVVSDEGVRAVNSSHEVEQFFSGAKDQYNEMGIREAHAEIQRMEHPTERIVMVEVRWPYVGDNGEELGEESSTYTLRRDDDGNLKICAVVMHGAMTDT